MPPEAAVSQSECSSSAPVPEPVPEFVPPAIVGHTVVLGIGNLLWADEGFGVRCLEALQQGWSLKPQHAEATLELVDGGTQGLYLLPQVQSARQLLIFDAIDYGLAPGTLRRIENADVPAYLGVRKMSLHQTGFAEVLALAQLTGETPSDLVLIGCQPEQLDDFGGSLSPSVRAAIAPALNLALEQLRRWGIDAQPRLLAPGPSALGIDQQADQQLDQSLTAKLDPSLPPFLGQDTVSHAAAALEMSRYERERPSAASACRSGDERFLPARPAA